MSDEDDARDAQRYRWLREQHWNSSMLAVVNAPKENVRLGAYLPSHELLDELIDRLRGVEQGLDPKKNQDAKRWRHKKRGTTYTVVARAHLQDSSLIGLFEGAQLVVYRADADGALYARHVDEFLDGRFEALKE